MTDRTKRSKRQITEQRDTRVARVQFESPTAPAVDEAIKTNEIFKELPFKPAPDNKYVYLSESAVPKRRRFGWLQRASRYALSRLEESSTMRSVVYLVTGVLGYSNPERIEVLIPLGVIVAGAIGAIFPDNFRRRHDHDYSPDRDDTGVSTGSGS